MECVRLHPDVDLEDSLANNIAVLRLGSGNSRNEKPKKTIAGVVTPRNAVDGLLNKLEATGCCFVVLTFSDCLDLRPAGEEDGGLHRPPPLPQHHLSPQD